MKCRICELEIQSGFQDCPHCDAHFPSIIHLRTVHLLLALVAFLIAWNLGSSAISKLDSTSFITGGLAIFFGMVCIAGVYYAILGRYEVDPNEAEIEEIRKEIKEELLGQTETRPIEANEKLSVGKKKNQILKYLKYGFGGVAAYIVILMITNPAQGEHELVLQNDYKQEFFVEMEKAKKKGGLESFVLGAAEFIGFNSDEYVRQQMENVVYRSNKLCSTMAERKSDGYETRSIGFLGKVYGPAYMQELGGYENLSLINKIVLITCAIGDIGAEQPIF